MRTCRDVMTKDPACCVPGETAATAAQLMKAGNVGSIPVVEDKGSKKLVGVVTDRDLALKIIAAEREAKTTTVADVMTFRPVTCRPEEDVQQAVDAMAQHQVRRLLVVDDESRIIGIIAQADVATRLQEPERIAGMVEKISQPTMVHPAMSVRS